MSLTQNHFNGLKVVELASVLAGPLVGTFFAELGAEVIKIEALNTQGDVTRQWRLANENPSHPVSAYYASANYGKKNIFLDLHKAADLEVCKNLLQDADVLIINLSQGKAKKYGLHYEAIKQAYPRLIYAEISGYGEGNERPAFDVLLQAETGYLSMSGESDGNPVKMPVAMIDILASHQLKEGVLIALLNRMKNGKGAKVHVSLFDAAISALINQACNWLMAGHIAQPLGTKHPNIAPYGDLFKTADDKYLVLAVGTNMQFQHLCDALELKNMDEFGENQERLAKREILNKLLQNAIAHYNLNDLLSKMNALKIPAAAIRNIQEVFENTDAQHLLLHQKETDNFESIRPATAVFRISH